MTSHKPCDFPHVLGYASPQAAPAVDSSAQWSDEDYQKLGAQTFEAWDPKETELPTNDDWSNTLMVLRLSYSINCKTKPQLVELVRDENKVLKELAEGISNSEKMVEAARMIMGCAFARLMSAACEVGTEGRPCN